MAKLHLGIITDQRLTMKPEIDYLRDRANSRLNVMMVMTHPSAGASPFVLRLFYIHSIRPLTGPVPQSEIFIGSLTNENPSTVTIAYTM